MATLTDRQGVPVLECSTDGPELGVEGATDLIGEALGTGAEWVLIPATRLGKTFFTLRTGIAGDITQKFVNYRLRLAIVGDISTFVATSTPLRDFVYESNRGRQLWFVDTEAEFNERLAP